MSRILGLDLGTNSIGIALRNTDNGGELSEQLEFYASDIFSSGVGKSKTGEFSYAAERTKHRSTRRLYQARKYRIWATLKVLIANKLCPLSLEDLDKWAKYEKGHGRCYPIGAKSFEQWVRLDFDEDGIPEYSSPYQLRAELMERQFNFDDELERYRLGRALYHIAQRRGFRSSKGETIKEQESNESLDTEIDLASSMKKSEEKKSSKLSNYMKEHNFKSIGCAFYDLEKSGIRIRNSEYQAVRSQYKDEISQIFDFQEGLQKNSDLYKSIISEKKNEGTIFYKRPLRSQKGLVGKCTLEPNKSRCPISHPEFEKFRALCFINNIKYKQSKGDQWQVLTLEQKEKLFNDKFMLLKATFKFEEIVKWIKANLEITVSYKDKTINYKENTSVSGCPVSARLKVILGDDWQNVKIETQKVREGKSAAHTKSYNAFDLWHICFSEDDIEKLVEISENIGFNENQKSDFLKLFGSIQQGYANLSLKAIRNINRFLEQGYIYTDATLLAKIPEIIGAQLWEDNKEGIVSELSSIIESNKSDKRYVSIANELISQYKSLDYTQQFAYKNFEYKLDESDYRDIEKAAERTIGKESWEVLPQEEKNDTINNVAELYQSFFSSKERDYVKCKKVSEVLVEKLTEIFGTEYKWDKLYHPSMIEYYEPSKDGHLKSPIIGALKNPMAMRVLHILRHRINNLIDEHLIDEDTRIVVETARELNDANWRWAIEEYNKSREKENIEIAKIIAELDSSRSISDADIDKVRLMFDQNDIIDSIENYQSPKHKQQFEIFKTDVTKYKLWKEQNCRCIYTGKIISLTSLFSGNGVDIEHTIPRSISFDSSLANLTVCDAHYNRAIKKNRIPAELEDYDKILQRIQPWIDKVEHLKDNVNFWKGKAKIAQDKDSKDRCIRQRHLWELELAYWEDKVSRFTMKEVKSGFKHSQLNDTRIITKYAYHYLRSVFNHVDVQKGSITADFRKILGVQSVEEKKLRDKHSHHAIDATMLTLIPSSSKRDRMLELFYKIEEAKRQNEEYASEERELKSLIDNCGIGKHPNNIKQYIEENILINHIAKDQTLTPSHKRTRRRGKIVWKRDEEGKIVLDENGEKVPKRWLTGDTIRGQLHKDSIFGAITQAVKDENGTLKRDEDGSIITDGTTYYVKRCDLKYKANKNDTGFTTWEEVKNAAVDKKLIDKLKIYSESKGLSFKEAATNGCCFKDSKGILHKVRHIRCYTSCKNPLKIKKQAYLSDKEYKQYTYADMGDLYAMCKYESEDKKDKQYVIWSKFDISQNRKNDLEDIPTTILSKKKEPLYIKQTLKSGDMLLIYKENIDELVDLNQSQLSNYLYVIRGFENDGNRINLVKHINAQQDSELGKGESIKDYSKMPQKIRCGINTLKFLVNGIDFKITPSGIEFVNR